MKLLVILFSLMQIIIFAICALEEGTLNILQWDTFVLMFEVCTFLALCTLFLVEVYKYKKEEKSITEKEKDEIPTEWS